MKPGWTSIVEMIELHKIIGKDFCNNQSAISLLLVWSIKTCIILLQEQNSEIFSFASWNILAGIRWNISSSVQCTICDPILESSPKMYLAHLSLFHFLSFDDICRKCKTWFRYFFLETWKTIFRMFWFESISLAPV